MGDTATPRTPSPKAHSLTQRWDAPDVPGRCPVMPGVMASCNTHGSEARHVQGPHGTHSVGDIQCCPHSAPVTPLTLALGVQRVVSLQNSHLTAASPCWLSMVPPSVLASHGSWCLWGPYNSDSVNRFPYSARPIWGVQNAIISTMVCAVPGVPKAPASQAASIGASP